MTRLSAIPEQNESLANPVGHMSENVWSAARLQGKAVGRVRSLRKCIRPFGGA
jgi:hypothetical protein